ncbi:MAG TPA: [protein-PII] uridylyltransferase [Pirellulales bacterium]|jgi:[protein-PII] uridylyltransferase|nr:[protein-PII] uridylyltransferase [Pirellulales bacterium]
MTGLRPPLLEAKQQLADGRAKLKARHEKGSPGIQVCRACTELFDSLVLSLFEQALEDLGEAGPEGLRASVALVPHAGYGRADVAPYSDVDLMLLYDDHGAERVSPLVERLVRDVYDIGLVLGQSVRTPAEASQLACRDATICTSLIESRFLAGNEDLFNRFARRFRRDVNRRRKSILAGMQEARHEERAQFDETVYLLEPNLKRSPGGLRDVQWLRWTGFVRYGAADPDVLRLMDVLSHEDHDALLRAYEFLLRLRNELHFYADKPNDVLDRAEQMRVAEKFGYQGTEGMLPVEQFMQDYFRMTKRVSQIAERFAVSARPGSWLLAMLSPLVSHQFERDFRVEPRQISANKRGLAKLRTSLVEILRLADLSSLYNKPISHATCEAIRAAVPNLSDEIAPEAAMRFLSLLSQKARLGQLLHALLDMGVLEKLIPAYTHAHGLLQFNVYHKYTVDEHCLRAVAAATEFTADKGPLGNVYRHLKRKWLLHLALLLHDLGKGFPEDHSEVGRQIADDTARRLFLKPSDAETLRFLVHKHLLMSHLAFRRDTSDNDLLVRFAVEVGSPEVLEMLYVMSAADLASVGPGVLNAWKVEVLTDLFRRAMRHLGLDDPSRDYVAQLDNRRHEVLSHLDNGSERPWFERQVATLPGSYLAMTAPETIADDLRPLSKLGSADVVARGRYQSDTETTEYSVGTYESITPGVFHKLTGALSSQGLQILSADINTLADGLVLDRFRVSDPDFSGEPFPERIDAVRRALFAALRQPADDPPAFRRVWGANDQRRHARLSPLPTQVRIDNSTSDRYTIVDVFAADRMGLLYTITRELFDLGLSVAVAKIGTYLDQVVDVFYVTDFTGRKIEHQHHRDEIRRRLFEKIEELERREAAGAGKW